MLLPCNSFVSFGNNSDLQIQGSATNISLVKDNILWIIKGIYWSQK